MTKPLPPVGENSAFFFDFDGTLVEIAARPDLVRVEPRVQDLLRALNDRFGGAVAVGYGYDSRVEVLGTRGLLSVGRQEHHATVTCTPEGQIRRPFVKSWRNLFMEAYAEEDRDFARAVAERRPPRVSGRDGMMAVQVVEAGNRSIREGRPVSLPVI